MIFKPIINISSINEYTVCILNWKSKAVLCDLYVLSGWFLFHFIHFLIATDLPFIVHICLNFMFSYALYDSTKSR